MKEFSYHIECYKHGCKTAMLRLNFASVKIQFQELSYQLYLDFHLTFLPDMFIFFIT